MDKKKDEKGDMKRKNGEKEIPYFKREIETVIPTVEKDSEWERKYKWKTVREKEFSGTKIYFFDLVNDPTQKGFHLRKEHFSNLHKSNYCTL